MPVEIHVYHHIILPGVPGLGDIMSVLSDKIDALATTVSQFAPAIDALAAKLADVPTEEEIAKVGEIEVTLTDALAKLQQLTPPPAPASA